MDLLAWLISAVLLFGNAPPEHSPDQPLSLSLSVDDAVAYALEHNARLQVAAAHARAAEERAEAAGKRDPIRFSLNPATILEQATAFITDVLGLSNKRKHASRVARHELAVVLASNAEFELELIASVKSTYWAVSLARSDLLALRTDVERAGAVRAHAQRLHEAGATDRMSVELAEIRLSAAEAALAEGAARLDTAQANLYMLLGIPLAAELDLVDAPALELIQPPPSEDLVALAQAWRPAVERVMALVGAAEAGVGVARAERLPEVSLGVGWEESQLFGYADVQFPLLDFGSIRHNIRANEADRRAAELELAALRQELGVEVLSAHNRLVSAQVVARAAADDAARREALAEAARARLGAGAAALTEVLDAQSEASESLRALYEAQLSLLDAAASLERSVGVPLAEMEASIAVLRATATEGTSE